MSNHKRILGRTPAELCRNARGAMLNLVNGLMAGVIAVLIFYYAHEAYLICDGVVDFFYCFHTIIATDLTELGLKLAGLIT